MSSERAFTAFRNIVWKHARESGRKRLPWRQTRDPYRILVSEIMLQQTQVDRVIPLYRAFLKEFPTVRALARAPLSSVLRRWSGLGYNRRARYLSEAARAMVKHHQGKVPVSFEALQNLPGVGVYTARAVLVFAFGEGDTMLETNIRTALIHHFFPSSKKKHLDANLLTLAQAVYGKHERANTRAWHNALMDYGAHLKKQGVRLNARSLAYTPQPRFEGSLRQVRGAILKTLLQKKPLQSVRKIYGARVDQALTALERNGLIKKSGQAWRIAR